MKVIDVSYFNGTINWNRAKHIIDGAIIRVGYRGYGQGTIKLDSRYTENIENVISHGVPVGVYFVTQAISEGEAREEARFALKMTAKYRLTYPIFIDSENCGAGKGRADATKLTKLQRTQIIKAFCEEIEAGGQTAGIYASESWYKDRLNLQELKKYYIWVAKYSANRPRIDFDAWQFTDKGIIGGIQGNVDISDFHYTEIKKTAEEIADEVIDGKWSYGEERIRLLAAAGYNVDRIQSIVNDKLKNKSAVYYTVKAGDTLSKIAKNYKTTIKKLKELNDIKDVNKINVGQILKVRG